MRLLAGGRSVSRIWKINQKVNNIIIADAGIAPNTGPNTGLHETGKIYLGALDTSMLFAYAGGLYVSGFLAEHSNLMGFLIMGMLGCCFSSVMYGYAYYTDIHALWYFAVVMVH